MANNENRGLYEILELFFCTTTEAELFADDNFRNLEVERIKTFIKYIDSYNNDTYQSILSAIPTDKEFLEDNYPAYFLWLNKGSEDSDAGVIEREIFEIRSKELSKLKEVLLGYIANNTENNFAQQNIKYNGFYFKGNHRKLRPFYKSLLDKGCIEGKYDEFSNIFKKEFEPSENRVLWKAQLSLLYYLISEIRKDKSKFEFGYKYKEIIPKLFDYTDAKGVRKPLDSKTFTRNSNHRVIDTKKIDNALRELE